MRTKAPTKRIVFECSTAPHHRSVPPGLKMAGTRDTGRARELRNVRADRTLWLTGCCDAMLPHPIACTSTASIPQTSPRSRDRKPLDLDLDTICHHRKAPSNHKRLELKSVGQVRNLNDAIGVPNGHDQINRSNGSTLGGVSS